jgi:hypothetical protein
MNADGSFPLDAIVTYPANWMYFGGALVSGPSWSPDGGVIAFAATVCWSDLGDCHAETGIFLQGFGAPSTARRLIVTDPEKPSTYPLQGVWKPAMLP